VPSANVKGIKSEKYAFNVQQQFLQRIRTI